jgi:hypothetical protein
MKNIVDKLVFFSSRVTNAQEDEKGSCSWRAKGVEISMFVIISRFICPVLGVLLLSFDHVETFLGVVCRKRLVGWVDTLCECIPGLLFLSLHRFHW